MKMLYLRKGKPLLVSNYVNLELDWYQGDTQTNYAQTNKPDWNYYDSEGKLKYKFNSLGYRTKEFNNLHMDPYMLVFGCSYTEGVGLYEEEIWCKHLADYLQLDYRNLAKAGTGPDIINFNTQLFKRSGFVKPKLVVVQWPQINRKSFGFHCEEGIRLEDRNVNKEETSESMAMRDTDWYMNRYIQETGEQVIQSMKDLFSVDNLWSALGVPVFHWTWEGDFTTDYGTKKIFKVVNTHKDLARDLQHDGPKIHYDAFEQFKDKVKCLI
jgi:hypothetical protein|tara:strand:+ start:174 stop:977 length:804 start_codon:yes stop_codon:yes gene_type:complete